MSGCSICTHEKAVDIAVACRTTGPNEVARTFSISKTSLLRHRDKCLGGVRPAPPPPAVIPAPDRAPSHDGKAHAGRPCATCRNPAREEIERRLLAGEPCSAIAKAIGPGAPSHDSILYHQRNCFAERFRRARAELQGAEVLSISADLEKLRAQAMGLLETAQACVDEARAKMAEETTVENAPAKVVAHRGYMNALRTAGELVGKTKGVLELVGKVTGELRTTVVVDIQKAAEWPAFVSAIGEAVADCDGCSKAVEEAVRVVGAKAAP